MPTIRCGDVRVFLCPLPLAMLKALPITVDGGREVRFASDVTIHPLSLSPVGLHDMLSEHLFRREPVVCAAQQP